MAYTCKDCGRKREEQDGKCLTTGQTRESYTCYILFMPYPKYTKLDARALVGYRSDICNDSMCEYSSV